MTDIETNKIVLEKEIQDGLYKIDYPDKPKSVNRHSMVVEDHFDCIYCNKSVKKNDVWSHPGDEGSRDGYQIAANTAGVMQRLSDNTLKNAIAWHKRLGHPHADRLVRLFQINQDLPRFTHNVVTAIFCHPSQVAKTKKAPAYESSRIKAVPLERVHIDVLGPMKTTSIGNREYTLRIFDDYTAKTDV